MGTADRAPGTQALRQARAAPKSEPEASGRERQLEHTGAGDPRPASSTVGAAAWNHLLDLYKQLQKSAMAKFLQESLAGKEKEEEGEEKKDEAGAAELSAPGASSFQSQPQASFRSTEPAGFMTSELKKLLEAQGKSGLWETASQEGEEQLAWPESCLAGPSEMAAREGRCPPVFQGRWRAREQGPRRAPRYLSPLEGPHGYPAGALGTEPVLPEEMEEQGPWAAK
ncbi:gametogenetin-binding protein 1-like [Sorex araneus]|uniref:gametogenetin-binding protein 1-like n=1 Tax=Sorex araneus TaxID=42254 RepID=UPI00243398AC|nr:gametogenetin-binding protein 1-like [Sorex araneus]